MVTPAPVDLTEILSALQDSINRGQGILEEVNLILQGFLVFI
jgi:hypothetical protein